MTTPDFDAIVVGGGPAGLMAAGACGARGRRVALFEKNRQLGRKLRITGKGRCNVTNGCTPRRPRPPLSVAAVFCGGPWPNSAPRT